MFFNDFPLFTQWQEIAFVTKGRSVRSFAAGVTKFIALCLVSSTAIATVFGMQFITELGELDMSLSGLSVVCVLVSLIPEAKTKYWGVKQYAEGLYE